MESPEGREQTTPVRRDRWAQFRGLTWRQLVLSLLPLGLIGVGGLLGGLFGGVGLVINLALARRPLGVVPKVAAMLGVAVAAYVIYFVVAGTILALVH